jgi:hypothetical protein
VFRSTTSSAAFTAAPRRRVVAPERALLGGAARSPHAGLAVGVASPSLTATGHRRLIPSAQEHLDFWPARLLAVLGNSFGTIAVVAVALLTIRRRPAGNALIVAGVVVAATGSGLAGLGVAETAAFIALAALLLYAGFVRTGVRRTG